MSRRFGGVRAVDEVSLAVLPGQTVSIIGPNGSGKTTLFNLISGHLRPDGGEIEFDGEQIAGLTADQIAERGIARTFQNGRVFGNMTVRENVLVGLHTRLRATRPFAGLRHLPGLRWVPLLAETALALVRPPRVRREEAAQDAEVDRQLARFGERLLPRREHLAYSLSYANRRRTEIARALAMGPRLLLLDEPTAGMNPTETAEVLDQINALRAEGQTILLIEHKLDLVMSLSDQVVVLDQGAVIAAGPPAEVRNDERVIAAYLGRKATASVPHPPTPSPVLGRGGALPMSAADGSTNHVRHLPLSRRRERGPGGEGYTESRFSKCNDNSRVDTSPAKAYYPTRTNGQPGTDDGNAANRWTLTALVCSRASGSTGRIVGRHQQERTRDARLQRVLPA